MIVIICFVLQWNQIVVELALCVKGKLIDEINADKDFCLMHLYLIINLNYNISLDSYRSSPHARNIYRERFMNNGNVSRLGVNL